MISPSKVKEDIQEKKDWNLRFSSFSGSQKVYRYGNIYPDIRVPFRRILLNPTKGENKQNIVNPPVDLYDTSGP